MAFPSIALEEHFMASNARSAILEDLGAERNFSPAFVEKLSDLAPAGPRVKAMDAGKLSTSVLSSIPGLCSCAPAAARTSNDELATACKAQPRRFRGFAALPMQHPAEAAAELERCVTQLGFVGAMIDAHLADGTYYDAAKFRPVFAKAAELDVPIYIHPTFPTPPVQAALYDGNFPPAAAMSLGISAWGWHSDTALSVLRMYCSGLFTEFPTLKIVIGHLGEMIPYMLARIDGRLKADEASAATSFADVWARNIYVTISGLFHVAPMACLLATTPIEHVMYSVDYPWGNHEQGYAFLQELLDRGLVSKETMELIAHKNAEKLLKFKV